MQNLRKQTYSTYSLISNTYLFTGREYEAESGLYYYRARHYSPALGRFLQKDPIGIWEDEINLGNGYSYVGNNAVNGTDAMGLVQGESKEIKFKCQEPAYSGCITACFFAAVATGGPWGLGVQLSCSYVCICSFCKGSIVEMICGSKTNAIMWKSSCDNLLKIINEPIYLNYEK